ncbi:MAG: YifB family Mg chelatase-like AAA ATPase [Christensenellaceae bacterium]
MLAKVNCFALNGLVGMPVEVETDVQSGVPAFEIVGLPDAAVKESKERVRSAIKNSGMKFPTHRITVNLAPADLKKEGAYFDLAIAISVMKACGQLQGTTEKVVMLGELALDGSIRGISGLLPILISAIDAGYREFIIPSVNRNEAAYLPGARVYPAKSVGEVFDHLSGKNPIPPLQTREFVAGLSDDVIDFSYIRGQRIAKRAAEIAVSGGHNLLLVGSPGSGKTMIARALPGILPDLTFEEALEVTKIHSVAGILTEEGIVRSRPFRAPHHTATSVALCGGGNQRVHPGEVSLAHHGVLYLDELPEYSRSTLEALRQPLEDGTISVARAMGVYTYPASFMLCASMNPCPCGNYGSRTQTCTCSEGAILKYRSKVSGPLLDRIDLQVEVDTVSYDELVGEGEAESSASVRERVNRARAIQRERFRGTNIHTNAEMKEPQLRKYCALLEDSEKILRAAYESMHLTTRGRSRIIKVARTIADLAGEESISAKHIYEAISYRTYDRR